MNDRPKAEGPHDIMTSTNLEIRKYSQTSIQTYIFYTRYLSYYRAAI